MRSNNFLILMALAVFAVSHSVSSTRVGPQEVENSVGPYQNITNLNDPHVQNVAKFAIGTYDKYKGLHLLFSRVLPGSQNQTVMSGTVTIGTNWHLFVEVFTTNIGEHIDVYETVVFEGKDGRQILVSFVEVK